MVEPHFSNFRIITAICVSEYLGILLYMGIGVSPTVLSFGTYGHEQTVQTWSDLIKVYTIWATTWQNQQNECAPSKDSDQPGHLPSLIRVLAVSMKKAWVLSYPLSAQRRLWSDWADAFTGRTLIFLVLSCCGSFEPYHKKPCLCRYATR